LKVTCNAVEKDSTGKAVRKKDAGLGLKAAWVGAEIFGDVLGKRKQSAEDQLSSSSSTATAVAPPPGVKTVDQVLESIRADYAEDYFISGKGEMADYDPQCLFADPFVSFRGVERFKKNVSNLGALISDVDLEITKWDVKPAEGTLEASWRFSAILDLPWKPRLAAAGSTTHIIDTDRGLVVEHIERWKSEPGEVVERLLRPAAKVPTNPWETFMLSFSDGDVKGCWMVVSGKAALLSAPVVALALITHLATGHALPGFVGGSVTEVLAGLLLVSGLTTEVVKFAQGMQGGETGTGGRF